MTERIRLFLFGSIILLYSSLSLLITWRESLTFDEIVYQEIGRTAWKNQEFTVDPYNPPFGYEITALPGIVWTDTALQDAHPLVYAFPGRMVTLAFSVMLLILVFRAGSIWMGSSVGLFAAAILAFEPTLLGHNHYITLDVIGTSLWFLAVFGIIRYIRVGGIFALIGTAISLGLAMATKITNVLFLLPLVFWFIFTKKNQKGGLFFWIQIIITGSIVLLVIWSTYFFRREPILVKHDNPDRVSNRLLRSPIASRFPIIKDGITALQNVPVPLGNYLAIVKNNILRSRSGGEVFFNGKIAPIPWYAIPVTLAYKLSLPWLVGWFWASLLVIRKWKSVQMELKVLWMLTLTTVAIAGLSGMAPLVRYVLPVIPLSALIIAWGVVQVRNRWIKLVVIILLLWHIGGTFSQFPHLIAYANEFSGPRKTRFLKFSDSNMDWGQGLLSLAAAMPVYQPKVLQLSYFGRDDGSVYGFTSSRAYGSYKADEICEFHTIKYPQYNNTGLVAISVSNWYGCGFSLEDRYSMHRVISVVGDSILLFPLDID